MDLSLFVGIVGFFFRKRGTLKKPWKLPSTDSLCSFSSSTFHSLRDHLAVLHSEAVATKSLPTSMIEVKLLMEEIRRSPPNM